MENKFKRVVARKVFVTDILNGEYIKRSGWDPNVLLTRYGEVSRINLFGFVVTYNDENNSFMIDDGTSSILVRSFESIESEKKYSMGDLVSVIGRIREHNNEKYIVPEITKKIENKDWFTHHQLSIKLQKLNSKKLPVEPTQEKMSETEDTGPYQKILNIIAILDKGNGADVTEIISNVKIDGCDNIIKNLIEEGEIFEISPGKVKLLE